MDQFLIFNHLSELHVSLYMLHVHHNICHVLVMYTTCLPSPSSLPRVHRMLYYNVFIWGEW